MMYPFDELDEEAANEEAVYQPKEYEINFETGQLTGRVVEGLEALQVWVWLALHTPRYRHYIYSWDYGQEYEDVIGQGYSRDYTEMELQRMTEECLTVNPHITGIENFTAEKDGERVILHFKLITDLGDAEVETDV